MQKWKRRIVKVLAAVAALYLLLLIPDKQHSSIVKGNKKPFAWNADSLWEKLEHDFLQNRRLDSLTLDKKCDSLFSIGKQYCELLQRPLAASDTAFDIALDNFFAYASAAAAHPYDVIRLDSLYMATRIAVKNQSLHWDIQNPEVRNRLYKMLYGMRAATEEADLQSMKQGGASMTWAPAPSHTPAANIFGLQVHSGDLLVSRGGAEVSAFISRGNDYPGNFSHVALLYIDEGTGKPLLIESHIEKGVAISSLEQYVADKKLRFLALRPRYDLPSLKADSALPGKAAMIAYKEATGRHIPYDFKMNYFDSSAMFCSEVGSYAYKKAGLQLWKPVSTISSQGVENWLHAFGVENFVTQMPSDLEYDPQLIVAGEWKDPETLFNDHIYNATMDALITEADKGAEIKYNHWMLPLARILKAYGSIQNYFGHASTIPEGMSATQALKNEWFVEKFGQVKILVLADAEKFFTEKKYRPPYWQLVKMAEAAAQKILH